MHLLCVIWYACENFSVGFWCKWWINKRLQRVKEKVNQCVLNTLNFSTSLKYLSVFFSKSWCHDVTKEQTRYNSCFGSDDRTPILAGKIWNTEFLKACHSFSDVEGKSLIETSASIWVLSVECTGYGSTYFPCALGRDLSWLWEKEFLLSVFFHEKVC